MALRPKDPLLALARIIVWIGQILMGIAAAALVVALPLLLFLQDRITAEVRAEKGDAAFTLPVLPIVGVLVLAFAIVAVFFLFLRNLKRIIDTVGEGDPFVPVNAVRLTRMAWQMLAVELLTLPLAGLGFHVARQIDGADASYDMAFDGSGLVLVVTLFILARVFREGARMRADLEGTV